MTCTIQPTCIAKTPDTLLSASCFGTVDISDGTFNLGIIHKGAEPRLQGDKGEIGMHTPGL